MTDLRAYARQTATRAGINPDFFERQIQQESGFNPDAYNPSGADGIAQIIVRWHPTMAGKTRDPIASLDYAADLVASLRRQFGGSYAKAFAAYNWGSGNVSGWDGRRETLPSETRHYLDVILGPDWPEPGATPMPTPRVTYNPDFPATIQDDDWSCAPSSLDWALRSLGRAPGHSYIENLLVRDGLVSQAQGLLTGTGGPLAAWIGKTAPADTYYGADGFYGNNQDSVSFDQVAAEAGLYPILIGGHNWGGPSLGHWTGVRALRNGVLALANPAGTSATYGGQTMSRAQFAARGPFSMIRVLHPDLLAVTPVPEPSPQPSEADALRARVAQLEAEKATLVSTLGYAAGDIADAIQAAVNTLRAQKPAA